MADLSPFLFEILQVWRYYIGTCMLPKHLIVVHIEGPEDPENSAEATILLTKDCISLSDESFVCHVSSQYTKPALMLLINILISFWVFERSQQFKILRKKGYAFLAFFYPDFDVLIRTASCIHYAANVNELLRHIL